MNFKIMTAVAVGSMLAATAAFANTAARFELANISGQQIDTIQVSPTSSNRWGPDLLGDSGVVANREVVVVTPGAPGCMFDVRVIYHDGSKEAFRDVNLCRTQRISFADTRDYVEN